MNIKPGAHHSRLATEGLGFLFWFVLIGATFSAGIDAFAWRVASFYYLLWTDRPIVLGVMFIINASFIPLPFFLRKAKRRPRNQQVKMIDIMGILVLLWALNILIAYILSCGFGSRCAFY